MPAWSNRSNGYILKGLRFDRRIARIPRGLVEIVRHPSRVYHLNWSSAHSYYFQATPAEINEFVAHFANARLRHHVIRIEAAVTNTVTPCCPAVYAAFDCAFVKRPVSSCRQTQAKHKRKTMKTPPTESAHGTEFQDMEPARATFGADCPCGAHHNSSPQRGVTRRHFLQGLGVAGVAAGTLAMTMTRTQAAGERMAAGTPFPRGKTLRVKPILVYDTRSRRDQESWRNYGAIQPGRRGAEEAGRIEKELGELKANRRSSRMEIQPVEVLDSQAKLGIGERRTRMCASFMPPATAPSGR